MPDLDASWWTVVPPLVVAALSIAVPGGLVVWALRLRGLAAVALAPIASVALWGGAGVITQVTGPFTLPWTMLGLTAVVGLVAWLVSRRRSAAPRPAESAARRPARLSGPWLAVAMAMSAIAMAVLSYQGVASPALPNQTYDGIFHVNLALWIQSTGQESAFQAYHMTDPLAGNAFYPNAWHLLAVVAASLSGSPIPTAFAALWIVLCGAIWLPGVVWAADVIVRPAHRTLALVTAALAGGAFPAFPYLLLNWGTLYPTALAMAVMPAGLALLVLAVRALRRQPGPLPWPAIIVAGLGWLLALALSHPRTLFTFLVLAVPYLVWQWFAIIRGNWRNARRARAAIWAAIPALLFVAGIATASVVILRMYADGRPLADRLGGGPATAHFTLWEGLWQALGMAPPSSPDEAMLLPSIALALAVLASAVLAAATTELRWLFLAWGAIWVLYLLAATSNDDVAKLLTGVWYKDKYRILSALPIAAVPMLAAGAEWLSGRSGSANARRAIPAIVGIAAAALALLSWLGPTLPQLAAKTGTEYAAGGADKNGRTIDADDVALLERAAAIIPKGERLLGDPWQGEIASWAVAGIEPVFPHFTGNWDPDRRLVAASLESPTPEVCAALDRLDAHYLLVDDEQTGRRAAGAQDFPGLAADGTTAIGSVIASHGSARLIRIAACG